MRKACESRESVSTRRHRQSWGDKRTRFWIPTTYQPLLTSGSQQLSAAAANDGLGKVRSGDWEAAFEPRQPAASIPKPR